MSSGGTSSGSGSGEKDKDSHWYFSAEQLTNSPSRRQGIDADTELSYRQMTAYLIQDMGQRLQVSQLCINTAIVYMHRFYAFHSFTHFHRNNIAAASLFLAAKVEEQPRKLEHVIKAANKCLSQPTSSTTDAYYIEQAQELVFNENVLLQTLGFDVAIDHPHTHVVKTCHLVKACKDLAQTSYFLASNSLHLTSMCLQYKPTVVACFCIYLACKWSRWEIPQSMEGKHWFHYVDKTVTMDLLKQLTDEFIAIYEKSPSRLKSKLNSIKALAQNASNRVINSKEKKEEWKMGDMMKMYAHDTPGSGGSSGGNSNQPYSTSSLAMEQSQQQSSALLPPPPPQTQLPRKSDLHSGQHRSHHNSSSHHSKINFPSSDVLDHKSSHKQPPFSGVVSRSRDHTQSSQGHQQPLIAGNSSRSSLSTSSGRSLSSIPGQNLPRQTSQGHQLDVNYHKSREKSNLISSYPHAAPSQPHSGLKVSQKQESNRVMQKEQTTVKMPEPGKSGSSSSINTNKLFPPTSSMSAMSQFGSNAPQAQNKLDMSQDMSRNLMHGQRGYGINNGSGSAPLLGSYQSQHARQSSNSNSNKHDLSKPTSVHLQQHGKQPSIPPESAYGTGTHETQQPAPHTQTHPSAGYLNIRPPEASSNEDNSTTQLPLVHAILQQPTNANQSKNSLFSPDWSEKLQPQQPQQIIGGNNYPNTSVPPPSGGDAFNYKLPLNKDSEREKSMDVSGVSIKKERNRGTHTGLDLTGSMMMGVRPNAPQSQFHQHMPQQQSFKISMPKKVDSNIMGDLTGINAAVKRPNEGAYKQDEEQNKIRKLDTQTTLSSYNDLKTSETNKLHVVNGIETNPDLVRSLLKESLCTSNALLKTEQLGAPSLQPPAELFEPSAMATSTIAAPTVETSFKSSLSSGTEPSSMEVNESSSSKAEKKKKKDKHKHKEKDKDKSKDREERKKHKKDKDKHKERDRGEIDSSEHVKIKISKDKIEGSAESLKIKIPKDRIISDMNSNSGNINNSADSGGTIVHPAPALKIKISKDKLENYATDSATHTSSQQVHALAQPTAGFYSSFVTPNNASGPTSHSSSGSSSSGKKKDRDRDKDRERDKEKKRGSNEIVKSNGSGSFHSASTLQGGAGGPLLTHLPPTTTTTTSKSQNPNKMQQLSNNMNQLFGESNDDDDDYDDDNKMSVNHKSYKDCHKNRVQNSDSFTSISASTNSAGYMRKGTDYGSKYSQSQQYNQR